MTHILERIQDQVSQIVALELQPFLPLPIENVYLVCRVYSIRPMFFDDLAKPIFGSDVNLQRWICKTRNNNVISISVG